VLTDLAESYRLKLILIMQTASKILQIGSAVTTAFQMSSTSANIHTHTHTHTHTHIRKRSGKRLVNKIEIIKKTVPNTSLNILSLEITILLSVYSAFRY
jgi:hypothetical protein